jgi:aminopeptidase YwaD
MYVPSPVEFSFPDIDIMPDVIPDNLKTISLTINNQYIKDYTTHNITAFIKGEIDTFIVFTSHYDHLGQMGKETYFPGANDNASGVAMVLDLANYYAHIKKKPKYSMAFIFFSAEELGLLGSKYYVQNPVFPLSKIKFLVNLDMVGSGDKGIKVVNGTVFKPEFDKLVELNQSNNYLSKVEIRGPAANSDHFPFYDKGVKCFFIYTLGEYSKYHSVDDMAKGLPLIEYEDLFKLLTGFVNSFGHN